MSWGRPVTAEREVSTSGLDRVVEHNAGDLTAVLEAGVPFAAAQERFAEAGQMLALDPPDRGAPIGGGVATRDSRPPGAPYRGPRAPGAGPGAAPPGGGPDKA